MEIANHYPIAWGNSCVPLTLPGSPVATEPTIYGMASEL